MLNSRSQRLCGQTQLVGKGKRHTTKILTNPNTMEIMPAPRTSCQKVEPMASLFMSALFRHPMVDMPRRIIAIPRARKLECLPKRPQYSRNQSSKKATSEVIRKTARFPSD